MHFNTRQSHTVVSSPVHFSLGSEALCFSQEANTALFVVLVYPFTPHFAFLSVRRSTLGVPLPLKIQTFRLCLYSGLKAYINTNNWSSWSHSDHLFRVSMESGDSCTFRLLKYSHTYSRFSQVTILMLSGGPVLETSRSALFPKRSN